MKHFMWKCIAIFGELIPGADIIEGVFLSGSGCSVFKITQLVFIYLSLIRCKFPNLQTRFKKSSWKFQSHVLTAKSSHCLGGIVCQ